MKILEYTYPQIIRKQRSITSLFPTFYQRVKGVTVKGGSRLVGIDKNKWTFNVTSGTQEGKKYEIKIEFVNTEDTIRDIIRTTKDIWTKEGRIDYRKLADEFIDKIDLKWSCNCPSDLYWGSRYIKTQRDAEENGEEYRRPRIRNPRESGALCKHAEVVLETFPFYVSTISKWLKENWDIIIKDEEEKIQKERGFYAAAGRYLGALQRARESKENKKYYYVTSCRTPEELNMDATELAQMVENSQIINKEEFLNNAEILPEHKKFLSTAYGTTYGYNKDYDIMWLYDINKDIHYFYS